jgi:hypothetical protein
MKEKIKEVVKNRYVSLGLVAALVFGAGFGIAKATSNGHRGDMRAAHEGSYFHNASMEHGGKGKRGGDPAKRVEKRVTKMTENLKLSDAQAQQIRQILMDDAKQMQAKWAEKKAAKKAAKDQATAPRTRPTDAEKEQMKAQMKAHREAVDQKIVAVLNAQQKEQYQKQMQERGNKRDGGRRGSKGAVKS